MQVKNTFTGASLALKRGGFVATAVAVIGLPIAASAAILPEIIVTAEKRESSIQDSPLSISAFSGEELKRQGITDTHGLGNIVPNVTIGAEGSRDSVFIAIRGISQSERRNTDDATTAFSIDGATVPRMSGVAAYFYDIERIEVLRGPQGTLYGRNSTSGVVNVITKKPTFDGYEGDFEFGYGNYANRSANGALNLPFSDSVAGRVAFTYNDRNGYRDNGPLVADGDDADNFGIRGHLLWNISDDTSLLISTDYYQRQGVGTVSNAVECAVEFGCDLFGSTKPWKGTPLDQEGSRDDSDTNFKIELNHSFSGFDFFAMTTNRVHKRNLTNDGNTLAGDDAIFDFGDGPVFIDSGAIETTESDSWSGELRLTSNTDSNLQWIVGAYFLDEVINGPFTFRAPFATDRFGPGSRNFHGQLMFVDKDLTIESWAIFANTSYDITDKVKLRAGLRYTEDEKDKGGNPDDPLSGSHQNFILEERGIPLGPFPKAQVANPDWSKTTYEIGLDWRLNDDTLAYAKYSTGYKAGGFNRGSDERTSGSPFVADLNIYRPETVKAYEIGIKTTFMDGRARVNLAAFYNDYKDKVEQATGLVAGIPQGIAVNATDVDISGLELESSFLYGESGGRIDLSVGWLDATYGDFDNLPDPQGGPDLDVSGNPPPNAPDWNANLTWVPFTVDFMGGMLNPRIQIAYKSDYITSPEDTFIDQQDAYTKSNASLYWESNNDGVYGEVYVRNIENEHVQVSSGCGGITFAQGAGINCTKMFAEPRTYGVRVGYRF